MGKLKEQYVKTVAGLLGNEQLTDVSMRVSLRAPLRVPRAMWSTDLFC